MILNGHPIIVNGYTTVEGKVVRIKGDEEEIANCTCGNIYFDFTSEDDKTIKYSCKKCGKELKNKFIKD